jgi:Kef-type K+ transport system membrane component KefB
VLRCARCNARRDRDTEAAVQALTLQNLAVVAAIAFASPLLLGLLPGLRVPSVLVEIGAGVALGPSGLGWVTADAAVQVMALIGVGFLLLLAGLEIDFDHLRGRVLNAALLGFAVSFAIALGVAFGLRAGGIGGSPLLIAVILSATSLAVVLPLLKDAGLLATPFGQVVIAGSSIADLATIVLLSVLFSADSSGLGARLGLLGAFLALCLVAAATVRGGGSLRRVSAVLVKLQDTTAQIRVRGAFVLLLAFSVFAQRFGLEAILGTFVAGAILNLADRDRAMTHGHFRAKLEEAGFGFFIPVFFVSSGIRLDAHALLGSTSALLHVPVFLAALYLIRGLPALIYRPLVGSRHAAAAGLLQATTLSFVLIASQIGQQLGLLSGATVAALTAAALVSVLVNPVAALLVLNGGEPGPVEPLPQAG